MMEKLSKREIQKLLDLIAYGNSPLLTKKERRTLNKEKVTYRKLLEKKEEKNLIYKHNPIEAYLGDSEIELEYLRNLKKRKEQ